MAAAATALVEIIADELGITTGLECLTTGDIGACGETALNVAMTLFAPGGVLAKLAVKYALRWGKFANLVPRIEKLGGEIISAISTLMKKDPGNAICPISNSFVPGTPGVDGRRHVQTDREGQDRRQGTGHRPRDR
ncbi:hypothetical protein [Thermobifida halotolerans]|uniref:hypothetical protein n=1 Tax=Thermobifida halotolerans TaxID=483545 RepID=UPI001F3F6D7C|nr:hypothetical protein [Thermobifida halotolerans]